MDNGQSTMDNEQWTMNNGQSTMDVIPYRHNPQPPKGGSQPASCIYSAYFHFYCVCSKYERNEVQLSKLEH